MKTALVHDWLIHMRGGERVLEAMAEVYPDATIYTLFCDPSRLSPALQKMKIRTSFLHYLPGIRSYYRWLLPIFPLIIRTLKIDPDTQLVISSSHCVAKGIPIPQGATHLCYCHTPMRYAWGFEDEYFGHFPAWLRFIIQKWMRYLRAWDLAASSNVRFFIANSENVRARIQKFYQREAEVIHPPVDIERFRCLDLEGEYYLVVSAFVPYKRVDLAIEAFNSLDQPLLIAGSGPLKDRYHALAKSPKIQFLGNISDEALAAVYAKAKALIFPTEEDFGIVPLEAQACGVPVIAYGRGGALESVKSGIFFDRQSPDSLREAILKFEENDYNRAQTALRVQPFSRERFQNHLKKFVQETLKNKA